MIQFKGEPTFQDFKEKFKEMDPWTYDTFEGEMGEGFDDWLKNALFSLRKKA